MIRGKVDYDFFEENSSVKLERHLYAQQLLDSSYREQRTCLRSKKNV